jgi:effector-binding domain-containing protein
MFDKTFARARFFALLCALSLAILAAPRHGWAEETTPAAPAAAAPGASAPAASPPAATAPAATTPAPVAPPAANAPAQAAPASPPAPQPAPPAGQPPAATAPGDSSETQTLEVQPRSAAYIESKATWEEGFAAIKTALASVNAELAKAGIKPTARPIAVFTETDDASFHYRAMVPIEAIPAGKTSLTDTIKFGETPAGKAMKFEHRGSYNDIDSTYEAITAYLDEKGLEAQNLFYEEYLNDVASPEDPTLEVDIYVLLK